MPPRPTSSNVDSACARRLALSTPRSSSPNATLSTSVRWGRRPKCWNTIETLWRLTSSSCCRSAAVTSTPSITTVPHVGAIKRVRHRTSVDFPLPDRPMTTNTSPGATSRSISRMATTLPVLASSALRGRSASSDPTTRSGFGPYTFHKSRTEIIEPALIELSKLSPRSPSPRILEGEPIGEPDHQYGGHERNEKERSDVSDRVLRRRVNTDRVRGALRATATLAP